jgi:hypothetical protein
MIVNLFTAHIHILVAMAKKYVKENFSWPSCFRKCCSCLSCCRKKIKTRKDILETYLGPEFQMDTRYSQMLTTIFVVLLYSSGMPLLYLLCFIFFITTYYLDRILLVKLYRSPPHIDLRMSKFFMKFIYWGVIIHLCFSIWIFGNKYILPYTDRTFLDTVSKSIGEYLVQFATSSFKAEIVRKLTIPHNIILLVLLCILFFGFIARTFIYRPLRFFYRLFWTKKANFKQGLNIYDGIYLTNI